VNTQIHIKVQDFVSKVPLAGELNRAIDLMERRLNERKVDNSKTLSGEEFERKWAECQANRKR
jgi:hypothetical protein